MTGSYTVTPGSKLDTGDYVWDKMTKRWYKLTHHTAKTRSARVILGVDKNGGRRALLLDSANVKAWVRNVEGS